MRWSCSDPPDPARRHCGCGHAAGPRRSAGRTDSRLERASQGGAAVTRSLPALAPRSDSAPCPAELADGRLEQDIQKPRARCDVVALPVLAVLHLLRPVLVSGLDGAGASRVVALRHRHRQPIAIGRPRGDHPQYQTMPSSRSPARDPQRISRAGAGHLRFEACRKRGPIGGRCPAPPAPAIPWAARVGPRLIGSATSGQAVAGRDPRPSERGRLGGERQQPGATLASRRPTCCRVSCPRWTGGNRRIRSGCPTVRILPLSPASKA